MSRTLEAPPAGTSAIKPFRQHRIAFAVLSAILVLWTAFLIVTYFTAVHRPGDTQTVETDR